MYKKEMDIILKKNVTDYAKYVITDRAIVSLTDGMKNIHRRIMWSMYLDGLLYNKNRTKSVNACGSVLRFSPHGDSSVYGACVRLANDSVMIPLIDGKGSFSSTTTRDIQAGASRYTEVRLSSISQEIIKNIDKDVIDMVQNYDETRLEPTEMPVTFPLVLCNPNLGIAIGLASNVCSFTLNDVIDNTINVIQGKETFTMIPDFPTGGMIIKNDAVLKQIKDSGTGTVYLKSKYHIENNSIVITEIPYTTTREAIIESIIKLVKDDKIKEVIDVNDYSGVDGFNVTIDMKKNTNPELLLQKLYKFNVPIKSSFSCNFTVLLNEKPITLGTDNILKEWVEFRRKCVKRLVSHNIKDKEKSLHSLKGLEKVLLDIDRAIEIIRHSKNDELILKTLCTTFTLDKEQANDVANIKLRNINEKYILNKIKSIKELEIELLGLKDTLNSTEKINEIMIQDLERVKKNYGKPRMTEIITEEDLPDISKSDLIDDFSTYCILTKDNYLKKLLKRTDDVKLKENDEILYQTSSSNKSTLLLFSNKGSCYKLYQHTLDECKPSNLGEYLPNVLSLEKDEYIISMVSTRKYSGSLVNIFENGLIAKINLQSFKTKTMRSKLENALSIESKLLQMVITEENKDIDILLSTSEGKILSLNSKQINSKGMKDTKGVVAINLGEFENNKVVGYILNVNIDNSFTIKTEKGKELYFVLNDVAPTGKENEERTLLTYLSGKIRNSGNFVINCRATNDRVLEFNMNK